MRTISSKSTSYRSNANASTRTSCTGSSSFPQTCPDPQPIRNAPAGTTTISGQSAQSRNTSPGILGEAQRAGPVQGQGFLPSSSTPPPSSRGRRRGNER